MCAGQRANDKHFFVSYPPARVHRVKIWVRVSWLECKQEQIFVSQRYHALRGSSYKDKDGSLHIMQSIIAARPGDWSECTNVSSQGDDGVRLCAPHYVCMLHVYYNADGSLHIMHSIFILGWKLLEQ